MTKIDKDDLEKEERFLRIENENDKEDAMRHMAWFALMGMLLYPSLIILSDYNNLERSLNILGNLAETYFVSVSGLVAVYFGANAYSKSSLMRE